MPPEPREPKFSSFNVGLLDVYSWNSPGNPPGESSTSINVAGGDDRVTEGCLVLGASRPGRGTVCERRGLLRRTRMPDRNCPSSSIRVPVQRVIVRRRVGPVHSHGAVVSSVGIHVRLDRIDLARRRVYPCCDVSVQAPERPAARSSIPRSCGMLRASATVPPATCAVAPSCQTRALPSHKSVTSTVSPLYANLC